MTDLSREMIDPPKLIVNERKFGLDAMRASAICLVLAAHLANGMELLGVCGVEVFFVLSGFLIGGILVDILDARGGFDSGDLRDFLRRRWYRTLPNYYFFLAIYLFYQWEIHPESGELPGAIARYAFFFQNFAWPNPDWNFGISWSLCVEEWFYLLFATILFLTLKLFPTSPRGRSWAIGITIGLFLSVPATLRFGLCHNFPDQRMVVIFRLDAIAYGVVMAFARCRLLRVWDRALTLLGVGIVTALTAVLMYGRSPTSTAISLTLMPIGFAGLLPICYRAPRPRSSWARWVTAVSIWSYSIYLSHILIYSSFKSIVAYDGLTWSWKLGFKLASIALIVAISALNYRFFEKPMTDLRDRR